MPTLYSLQALQWRLLPFAVERLRLGPKKTQEHQEWPTRRRQPIGFFVLARRIVLDVQCHAPVSVALQIRQHRQIDEVAVEGIRNKEPGRQFIYCQRPERVDRWQLARREAQSI